MVLNKILPFSKVRAVRAAVYHAESAEPPNAQTVVLDYTVSSLPWSLIRDEMRLVAPYVYLGLVYLAGNKLFYFVLEATEKKVE